MLAKSVMNPELFATAVRK